jgi:pilus assembly protein CpaF
MFVITLAERNGDSQQLEFDKNEVTIGRLNGNDIVLQKGNVSKYHSRIVLKDGKFIIVDMKSTNGTYVNGKKIAAPQVIRPSDKIYIGDYIINVDAKAGESEEGDVPEAEPDEAPADDAPPEDDPGEEQAASAEEGEEAEQEAEAAPSPASTRQAPAARGRAAAQPALKNGDGVSHARMPASLAAALARKSRTRADPKLERYTQLQKDIHDRLIEYLDLRRLDMDRLGDEELWRRTEKAIRDILEQMDNDGELSEEVDRDGLLNDVLNEALGLGPLEAFLGNEDISEIMVNHASQIYIEKKGKITLSDKVFSSNQAVLGVIERIVAPIGRRIDESSPLVDARLKDGSRVNAIIPPLALKGPCITIRKFKRDALKVEDLIRYKTITPQMAEFMEMCVKARKNIVISGGTGSGKTTTLNIISSFIPDDERIVTVEDAAELQLPQDHWVQLESRPPNLEGKGAITIRELVKNCLRMRPDRIVVGECRSGEALDMLQAMNTGHDGSLTTLHANTPRDALARLETMVLMAGMDLPMKAIREQIASAVQIIVQQTRFSDGTRKICFITEVSGMEVDIITLQDIFFYKQEGFSEDGKVRGRFVASGFVPKFYDELQRRGIPVNMSIFREE